MDKKTLRELQNIAKELKVIAKNTKKDNLVEVGELELMEANLSEFDVERIVSEVFKKMKVLKGN